MHRVVAGLLVLGSIGVGGASGLALQRSSDRPAAAGAQVPGAGSPTAEPSGSSSGTPASPTQAVPWTDTHTVDELVVAPGRLGPLRAGMDQREWEVSGALERDVEREQTCEGVQLRWRGDFGGVADVILDRQGLITLMGVTAPGPTTAEGIGVGSTYAELQAAYGEQLTAPRRNEYDQTLLMLRQGRAWLGFLLDEVDDDSPVVFMEVSRGREPGLFRDGC